MVMRVVPVGAAGVIVRNLDLDRVALTRLERAEDVVGVSLRTDVRAVEMEVGGVEQVRQVLVERRLDTVRWQLVDEIDAQGVARLHA